MQVPLMSIPQPKLQYLKSDMESIPKIEPEKEMEDF